ncbi:MAG: YbhB/YbcL family Raf kinase inhibitor-like protein [Arcanobacterium sp.]|nr:YbhB/YbcL family Raf kinase inhibitor-like protein [Arcanobacterium sp.]
MDRTRPVAPNPYDYLPKAEAFTLTSDAFRDGDVIPAKYGLENDDVSPQLSWSGFPAGTKSFAVTCFDPDAPTPSGYWHWTVLDIPPHITELPEGAGSSDSTLPEGAFHVRSDYGTLRYGGMNPPVGDQKHHYYFVVHALDVDTLGLDAGASPVEAAFTMGMHTIGRAILVGTFQR